MSSAPGAVVGEGTGLGDGVEPDGGGDVPRRGPLGVHPPGQGHVEEAGQLGRGGMEVDVSAHGRGEPKAGCRPARHGDPPGAAPGGSSFAQPAGLGQARSRHGPGGIAGPGGQEGQVPVGLEGPGHFGIRGGAEAGGKEVGGGGGPAGLDDQTAACSSRVSDGRRPRPVRPSTRPPVPSGPGSRCPGDRRGRSGAF